MGKVDQTFVGDAELFHPRNLEGNGTIRAGLEDAAGVTSDVAMELECDSHSFCAMMSS
jgi:hypothetical protein